RSRPRYKFGFFVLGHSCLPNVMISVPTTQINGEAANKSFASDCSNCLKTARKYLPFKYITIFEYMKSRSGFGRPEPNSSDRPYEFAVPACSALIVDPVLAISLRDSHRQFLGSEFL